MEGRANAGTLPKSCHVLPPSELRARLRLVPAQSIPRTAERWETAFVGIVEADAPVRSSDFAAEF
jgi:hypothetical protein